MFEIRPSRDSPTIVVKFLFAHDRDCVFEMVASDISTSAAALRSYDGKVGSAAGGKWYGGVYGFEGQVEGKIELRQNVLTIGANGKIKAQVFAKSVIILGEVTGNVTASEKVDIRDNGSVDGDIASPRVAIAEGAHFRGSIDKQKGGTTQKSEGKPAAAAAASPAGPSATVCGRGGARS